jgi:hypothetical protein
VAGYQKRRPDWIAWPDTSTPIREADLDAWEQAIYDLKYLTYNIVDFGASIGGTAAANKTAIQATIDAANTAGGGIVYVPPGSFTTNGPLTVYDSRILGSVTGDSKLTLANGSNSDLFASPDDGVQRYWLDISYLNLDGNAANQTTGNVINIRGMNEAHIYRVRIANPKNNAIRIGQATGGITCTVPMIHECLLRGDVTNTTGAGIDADSGSSDCMLNHNDIGFFKQGAGILLSGHNGGELIGNQCWQNKHGYQFFSANRFRVIGCLSDLALNYGFVSQQSSDMQFIGCQARESSQTGLNGADGFFIEGTVGGPVASDILVVGCRAMSTLARYGLVLNQQLDNVHVFGSDFRGNQTGEVLLGATAVTNVSQDGIGTGTTANRPTARLFAGKVYFDTTLGKPVFFKTGSTWVDATGATV